MASESSFPPEYIQTTYMLQGARNEAGASQISQRDSTDSMTEHVARNSHAQTASQSSGSPELPRRPVVLTWDRPPSPLVEPMFTPEALYQDTAPEDNPPEYGIARRPTQILKYSFSPLAFNSMILVPPAEAPDSRPLYHISHSINGFMPYSMITVIRRGGLDTGEIVGDFKIGIIGRPGSVMMYGNEYLLRDIVTRKQTHGHQFTYTWAYPSHQKLLWNVSALDIVCYKTAQDEPLARLHSAAKQLRRAHTRVKETQLEVFPEGHEYLDDILISALIVERMRLVKRGRVDDLKDLFSWWPNSS